MSGYDIVDLTFGFISIVEQMIDHHGFCELEMVDFTFGFIMILEYFKEAMSKLRQVRKPM